jgi:hypothetical protein
MSGPDDTTRVGAGPNGIVRTIVGRWGRRVVVTRRLVIDLFELKFDRLNMNSIVWTEKLAVFTVKNPKNLKISNFAPPPTI